MSSCCENKSCEIEALKAKHSSVLKIVLYINLIMFFVEMTSGWISGSLALMGDSLDMFGDATVYALSIYTLSRVNLRANVTLLKGGVMVAMAVAVLAGVVGRLTASRVPAAETMSIIGGLALFANIICFALLYRHRSDDINMKSVWLCSRNDLIANTAVVLSAGAVWYFKSSIPDLVVGAGIAVLFLSSAVQVVRDALKEKTELQKGVSVNP